MNRFFIFSLVAVLFTAASCSQKKEIVVEHPPYVMRNSSSAEIDKIVLNDTATVLYITNYSYPNSRFRYSAETYIRANNLKYTVIKADGIELDKWLSEPTGKTSFTLTFPPIPRETRKIDFIESDCDNCFKTWGIELKSKTLTDRLPVPAKIAKFKVDPTDRTPLQTPVFKDTAAIIKGRILGYRPELFRNINVYINNPFTGNQDECETTVENDGTFSVSVPVFCTMGVLFRAWNLINSYVYVSPGEETEIYLDLQQLYQQSCRDRIDKCEPKKWVFFGGANADINTQHYETVSDYIASCFNYQQMMNDIPVMTAEQYKNYWLEKMNLAVAGLNDLQLSQKMRELSEIEIRLTGFYYLTMGEYFIEDAYKQAHDIDEAPDFKRPVFTLQYYDFIKDIPLNNPLSLYSEEYSSAVNNSAFIHYHSDSSGIYTHTATFRLYDMLPALAEFKKLSPDELETVKLLQKMSENDIESMFQKNLPKDRMLITKVSSLIEKYQNDLLFLINDSSEQGAIPCLKKLTGDDKGILFDLIKLQQFARKFEEYQPLDIEFTSIAKMDNPFYLEYFTERNNALLAQIEANKSKTGFNVHTTPDVANDKLFDAIVKPYQGRVVIVDFWNTWCAPCRHAMKQLEPAKTDYQGKDVVFVYIADESSPAGAWQNMIPNIHGEHYRLESDKAKYLRRKFNIDGIPAYVILSKKSEQVYFHTGFPGVNTVKQVIDTELAK